MICNGKIILSLSQLLPDKHRVYYWGKFNKISKYVAIAMTTNLMLDGNVGENIPMR